MTEAIGNLLLQGWRAIGGADGNSIYNEVLHAVSARATAGKAIDKADIGALVLWKRITAQTRWANELMRTPDASVRAATGVAYERANDPSVIIPAAGQGAREALLGLPGMGGTAALASAVLVALAPNRMAVWDRRVGTTLSALGKSPKTGSGFYGRYLNTTLELAQAMEKASTEGRPFVPRDVDLALFYIAGDSEMLSTTRLIASTAD